MTAINSTIRISDQAYEYLTTRAKKLDTTIVLLIEEIIEHAVKSASDEH